MARSVPVRMSGMPVSMLAIVAVCGAAGTVQADGPQESRVVAAEVDRLIVEEARGAAKVAPRAGDEDFLRRITFDFAGTLPSARDVTFFGLDPDPQKREKLIDRLLESDDFAANWARYWRDVIFTRATDMRAGLAQQGFEEWIRGELKRNTPWDRIATSLLTATGDVRENGATALIFAHAADPAELAGEVSRIFLGIQIQCANCHDHPTDSWKREQFHELAAFFPRTSLRPTMATPRSFEIVSLDDTLAGRVGNVTAADPLAQFRENPERTIRLLDKNGDGMLAKSEVEDAPLGRIFDRLVQLGDTNKDGLLSADEIKKLPAPMMMQGRGSREYYMPDLLNPGSRGKQVDPVFFVSLEKPGKDRGDLQRRESLASYVTSPKNAWFAKALVNRLWGEMLGEAFYTPIDDLGPQREARHPKALDALAEGFVASGHDMRWLFRTIALTDAYQRSIRAKSADGSDAAFLAAAPTRLRSDQLYSAILKALGLAEPAGPAPGMGGINPFGRGGGPRQQFAQLFAFDPSTPQDDVVGSVPQALYLMNAPQVSGQIRATGGTVLAEILQKFPNDDDALSELYLQVLAREPSGRELTICRDHVAEVKNRGEAFEDLMWSLLNSSEFLSKR